MLARRVRVRDAKLDSVNFRSAVLTDVAFEDCVLRDVDFGGATLLRVSFAGCTLADVDFTKVDMHGGRPARRFAGHRGPLQWLRGARIDSVQLVALAPFLARHLGLVVTD